MMFLWYANFIYLIRSIEHGLTLKWFISVCLICSKEHYHSRFWNLLHILNKWHKEYFHFSYNYVNIQFYETNCPKYHELLIILLFHLLIWILTVFYSLEIVSETNPAHMIVSSFYLNEQYLFHILKSLEFGVWIYKYFLGCFTIFPVS